MVTTHHPPVELPRPLGRRRSNAAIQGNSLETVCRRVHLRLQSMRHNGVFCFWIKQVYVFRSYFHAQRITGFDLLSPIGNDHEFG